MEEKHLGRDLQNHFDICRKTCFCTGNTNVYDKEHPEFSLEDIRLEMSSYGKGDIREPFVEILHGDGSFTSDFCYEKAEITEGKGGVSDAAGSYDEMMKWSIYV